MSAGVDIGVIAAGLGVLTVIESSVEGIGVIAAGLGALGVVAAAGLGASRTWVVALSWLSS